MRNVIDVCGVQVQLNSAHHLITMVVWCVLYVAYAEPPFSLFGEHIWKEITMIKVYR